MTNPTLRAALSQIPLEEGNLSRNMELAAAAAAHAASHGTDLFCLPEAADFGWLHQAAREDALPVPGRYTEFLCGLAVRHGMWVAAGCLERDGSRVYNSAVLIGRAGQIVLKHRKFSILPDLTSHLYDAGSADDIRTADTEFGRLGLTICADNFDPAVPRRVAELGAWLLVAPHGFAAPVEEMEENSRKFRKHVCGMAADTGMWVAAANAVLAEVKGGAWKGRMHCGCSTVARPNGSAAAVGKFKQPDLIIYDIPLGSCAKS